MYFRGMSEYLLQRWPLLLAATYLFFCLWRLRATRGLKLMPAKYRGLPRWKRYWNQSLKWLRKRCGSEAEPGECPEIIFIKGSEIPQNKPALFIYCIFISQSTFIRVFDVLTLGTLSLIEIIPVGKPIELRIFFKNISPEHPLIKGYQIKYFIRYPGGMAGSGPSRGWYARIPTLKTKGQSCNKSQKDFFVPEVPGAHELIIDTSGAVWYAGAFGLGARPYKITTMQNGDPPKEVSGNINFTFHVSSHHEYKMFIIVFVTLGVALIALLSSLAPYLKSLI